MDFLAGLRLSGSERVSDCDKDVEKALATLENLSARELEVTGEKLSRRRDGLRGFGLVFGDVARKRPRRSRR